MFASAVRSAGDQAGVFEHDGDTGYFYLYEIKGEEMRKILAAIRAVVGTPAFEKQDVAIRWDASESKVGLFICGQLCAAFDGETGAKYGGDYHGSVQADIPAEVVDAFEEE